MAAYGEGCDLLRRTQWGYATHPNLGAALDGRPRLRGVPDRPHEGGLWPGRGRPLPDHDDPGDRRHRKDRSTQGVERIKAMLPMAARAKRETRPASEIMLALQCGGSDGYSGITANPALGAAVDMLVRHGGTAVLAETPEIYGAEHLLTRRAVNRAVGEKLVERIKLVGGLHRAQRRRDEQQSLAGQQGRRAHHHSGKVARRGRQGRHHDAARRLRICRAGEGERLRVHGHARLRSGRRHRPGGGRLQRDVLHHRPRLGFRLQADAVDQARHQHRRCIGA